MSLLEEDLDTQREECHVKKAAEIEAASSQGMPAASRS